VFKWADLALGATEVKHQNGNFQPKMDETCGADLRDRPEFFL
jgi:hypothetical protein